MRYQLMSTTRTPKYTWSNCCFDSSIEKENMEWEEKNDEELNPNDYKWLWWHQQDIMIPCKETRGFSPTIDSFLLTE